VASVIAQKFLPDRIRIIQNPLILVDDFINTLMNLLVTGDTQTRDVVREALGFELSPRLYGKLIKNLES
jgi:neurofibromin 1